jgi:hypothetical protein
LRERISLRTKGLNMQIPPMASISVLYAELSGRSTRLPWTGVGVHGWVEVGVVVHLHLAIELEAAGSGLDLRPKVVEAGGEVGTLFVEESQAGAILVVMCLGGGGAMGLLFGVVKLERENGEAVDHEAGRFGVEGGRGILCAGGFEESAVDGFDEVIAALVEDVDVALDLSDASVGGAGFAGLVLFVPEVEVGTMMGEEEVVEGGGCGDGGGRIGMGVPIDGGVVLEIGDVGGVEHRDMTV